MKVDEKKAEEAFHAYAEAKRRVDETLEFADGCRAARAWVEFMNVFLPAEQQFPESNIIEFPGRRTAQ